MPSSSDPQRQQVLRFVWQLVSPYRLAIFMAFGALVFTATIMLSLGQGLRILIDQGLAAQSSEMLAHSVMIFMLLVVALAAGSYTRFYWVSWLGERVITDLRRKVFDHLLSLNPGFFEENRALEIQSRLTTDTTLLQSIIGSSLSMALRNIIMMLGGLVLMFVTNTKLTLIVLFVVPLVVVPILYYGRKVRVLSRHSQDRVADVGSYVGETLSQIKTVQAYNHESVDRDRFAAVAEQAFEVALRRTVQRAILITVVIILVMGAVGFMLWTGGNDVIQNRITGGELAAFVFYAIIVGSAVGTVSEVIGELQRAAGATTRIMELLEAQSPIQTASQCKPLPENSCETPIRLDQLWFSYSSRPEKPAIRDLSLTVSRGETLAIVGPSGAGKSTLFDLLLRFADPQRGSIAVNGCDIREVDLTALRSQFALVSQHPDLFHGTIEDNLRFGKPDASLQDVQQAAREARAHEFITALPQGYQTRLGDKGSGLSGGQKQRLAIARALLVNAPILLLDEATSALDAENEFMIQEALQRLMQGRTTLVIAHRLSTIAHADRIAVLDEGSLQAIGNHESLLRDSPLYARLASLQFKEGSKAEEENAVV